MEQRGSEKLAMAGGARFELASGGEISFLPPFHSQLFCILSTCFLRKP
jgi:hypothetical protein